jgi:hypothetical protein
MDIQKYLENQLEILVSSLVSIPLAHQQNKHSLQEIEDFIKTKKQSNGKSLLKSFQNDVSKSLEKLILNPLNSWLESDLKESITVRSPVQSPVHSPMHSPVKEKSEVVSPRVSSSTVVEKVPTPAKKTTKKPPTPKGGDNLVQSTITQSTLVQAHPLMTGENLEKTTRKTKSSTSVPENYSGPKCKYVFKRGELKGKECGKPAMVDGEYCEQCNTKKTNKPLETKDEKPKEKKVKPAVENKPMVGFTTSVGKRTLEKPKIELRETGQPNTYLDIQTNFIVKKVVEQDRTLFVAVGIQEESGFRTLNEEEKKQALNRNFTLTGTSESKEQNKDQSKEPTEHKSPQKSPKKIVAKQPVNNIPDIESDNE